MPSKKKQHYTYLLKLRRGKYYVGSTTNPKSRFQQHLKGGRFGAAWTTKHKPVTLVNARRVPPTLTPRQAEDRRVKREMKKFGIANVRGGSYSQVKLTKETSKGLRGTIFKKKRLTAHCKQIETWHEAGACVKCGSKRHWAHQCKKK